MAAKQTGSCTICLGASTVCIAPLQFGKEQLHVSTLGWHSRAWHPAHLLESAACALDSLDCELELHLIICLHGLGQVLPDLTLVLLSLSSTPAVPGTGGMA